MPITNPTSLPLNLMNCGTNLEDGAREVAAKRTVGGCTARGKCFDVGGVECDGGDADEDVGWAEAEWRPIGGDFGVGAVPNYCLHSCCWKTTRVDMRLLKKGPGGIGRPSFCCAQVVDGVSTAGSRSRSYMGECTPTAMDY